MKLRIYSLMLLPLLLAGCGRTDPPPPPSIDANVDAIKKGSPIDEVVQTINVPAEDAWEIILQILEREGLKVAIADSNSGEIQSAWIALNDSLCGSVPAHKAPLPCKARYSVMLDSLTGRASSVRIKYEENCLDHKAVNIVCSGSNAEKLMLRISEQLRVDAEAYDTASQPKAKEQ